VVHVDGDRFAPRSKGPGWLNYAVASVQALARFGDNSRMPSRNAANVFASRLRAHGIRAAVGANQDAAADAKVIAEEPGHTVAESLAVMLSRSESNIAEVLFRQTAIATGYKPTWAGGRRAALATLATLGISTHDVQLWDGSGLSRKDLLTPRFLTSMLRLVKVEQPERFAAMFKTSAMPVAGVSGTLTPAYGRYSTSPSRCAAGRVQAKTGTLFDTIALSGVARSKDGLRIFSFIVNNRPRRFTPLSTRRAIDGLAATVVGCWK
jgi:serine-type D-Ala-D-Ala carboxypeptidase/endopeptidase (penicillin-binding protein 4)